MIWLIGDTHFGHKNIIDYCDRPFKNISEMNEALIQNWNKVVNHTDEVFMMGDFALCGKDELIAYGKRLKGRKRLILGNHDGASINTYREAGFEYVYNYPIIVEDYYIFSHEPIFVKNNGLYYNIFAHVHVNPEYVDYSPRSFCTSVERINYTPISFDEVKEKMKSAR